MKETGVRELKAHLSKYLREVKKGNKIIVTERGERIAQILPLKSYKKKERIYDSLSKLAKESLILLPRQWGKPQGHPQRVKVKGAQFSNAVIEARR